MADSPRHVLTGRQIELFRDLRAIEAAYIEGYRLPPVPTMPHDGYPHIQEAETAGFGALIENSQGDWGRATAQHRYGGGDGLDDSMSAAERASEDAAKFASHPANQGPSEAPAGEPWIAPPVAPHVEPALGEE